MSLSDLKKLQTSITIDARGTSCPGPLLEATKAIGILADGEIMEVFSSDEGTKEEIRKWCSKEGLIYLGSIDETGYFKVFVMKKQEIH